MNVPIRSWKIIFLGWNKWKDWESIVFCFFCVNCCEQTFPSWLRHVPIFDAQHSLLWQTPHHCWFARMISWYFRRSALNWFQQSRKNMQKVLWPNTHDFSCYKDIFMTCPRQWDALEAPAGASPPTQRVPARGVRTEFFDRSGLVVGGGYGVRVSIEIYRNPHESYRKQPCEGCNMMQLHLSESIGNNIYL